MSTVGDRVLEAVTVRPGDILLLRVSPDLDPRELEALGGAAQRWARSLGVRVEIVACEQIAAIHGGGGR
ncbi:hypothetical protein GCM10027160_28970 [Streptomyces calidiresistens]|uniref:Uncharacterized protein n=1 Tax=Streptomyces calidiresistens TaxID=1485586 RepID=A0A7W3XV87_9ACTN|nr:hypothetical protein [Streptomyces calidiresistens]MBB0228516.1 hypothetical protein [Streptomyces calidiresistens]